MGVVKLRSGDAPQVSRTGMQVTARFILSLSTGSRTFMIKPDYGSGDLKQRCKPNADQNVDVIRRHHDGHFGGTTNPSTLSVIAKIAWPPFEEMSGTFV